MSDESNTPMTIQLEQSDGAMTKLFPLVQSSDSKQEQYPHLVQEPKPQNIEIPCTPMTLTLSEPTQLYEAQLTEISRSIANAKVERDLEDAIADCTQHLKTDDKVTVDLAWSGKAHKLPHGSDAIYHDLTLLCAQLRTQMGTSLTHSSNHLTLLVPASHLSFLLAKTDTGESALTMFKALMPEVELVMVPQLLYKKESNPCALLLCTSNALSPVGYMAVEGVFYVRPNNDSDNNSYTLHIPSHKLAIVNPTQMAVLTGI